MSTPTESETAQLEERSYVEGEPEEEEEEEEEEQPPIGGGGFLAGITVTTEISIKPHDEDADVAGSSVVAGGQQQKVAEDN
ncbi:hypothetical protein C8035_v010778 [Colletotrichum spinosum]|uniref:Uncharacterized protein n=1 Tax=Colletotrichum spinosum TaxID=1347390 RepID=A0A4R8QET0_9PEZI|nr:hypothetical protein C8035_v010778 [Colletotrichum spinosum]